MICRARSVAMGAKWLINPSLMGSYFITSNVPKLVEHIMSVH